MEIVFISVLVILTLSLWIWAIVDIVKSSFKDRAQKILWILVVVLFPILGPIVYFQVGRNYTNRKSRKFNPSFNRVD
ncbi:MAG: phospholipase [Bacteroidetes bacterium]|nr:MAG: phospholipase [Bacteroidota bacterium]